MNLEKAVQVLKVHNIWRRGANTEPTNPKELGIAIDIITNHLTGKEMSNKTEMQHALDHIKDELSDLGRLLGLSKKEITTLHNNDYKGLKLDQAYKISRTYNVDIQASEGKWKIKSFN